MQSPLEKSKAMPSAAPCMKILSYACITDGGRSPWVVKTDSPQELETMSARWPSTIFASAASRSLSTQELAATVITLESGARPCAISTSSDSSLVSPPPHWSRAVHCDGSVISEYCPGANGLSPWFVEYWFASASMVDEAYQLTMAIVAPLPVRPAFVTP